MNTFNISNAKSNLFKIAQETIETNEPVVFTGKNGDVVLLSKNDYDSMIETMYLHTNHGLITEAKNINNTSDNDLVSRDKLPW